MRKEIENYINEGRRRKVLCKKYDEMLSEADTARAFYEAALSVQGMDFVCSSVRDGWFLSPENVWGMFSRMLNGKFTYNGPGYSSKMYYRYKGSVLADTTALCIVESNIAVKVPRNKRIRVYAAGKCEIRIIGEGSAIVEAYGCEDLFDIKGDDSKVEKKFLSSGQTE